MIKGIDKCIKLYYLKEKASNDNHSHYLTVAHPPCLSPQSCRAGVIIASFLVHCQHYIKN